MAGRRGHQRSGSRNDRRSPTLTHEEHRRVVQLCVEVAKGRVPVIAGAGSNNTAEAIALAQYAEKVGADAVLVVTPYYNKPTQRGLYAHFAAVAKATSLPIIIYNIPPRSVIDMTPETMGQLVGDFSNIVGVRTRPARSSAFPSSASPAARISSSFRARMPPRSASTPMAASARSR